MKKILFILFVLLSLTACVVEEQDMLKGVGGGDTDLLIPDNLKIKAKKDKILNSREKIHTIEKPDKSTFDLSITTYDYISNEKAEGVYFEPNDNYSNVKSKVIKDGKTVYKLVSGDRYYKDDNGEVFIISKNATTTTEAFNIQTADTVIEKISKIFFKKATAADKYYEASSAATIYYNLSSSWATTHDAASGAAIQNGANSGTASVGYRTGSKYLIWRIWMPFDTSAIGDGDTIASANLAWWTANIYDNDNDGYDFMSVTEGTPTDPTSLVVGDYDELTFVEGIDSGDRKDITGQDVNEFKIFALNATGIGWINKTGYTTLCPIEGHDLLDHSPITSDGTDTGFNARFPAWDGTAVCGSQDCADAYLEVTIGGGGGAVAPTYKQDTYWFN